MENELIDLLEEPVGEFLRVVFGTDVHPVQLAHETLLPELGAVLAGQQEQLIEVHVVTDAVVGQEDLWGYRGEEEDYGPSKEEPSDKDLVTSWGYLVSDTASTELVVHGDRHEGTCGQIYFGIQ